MSDEMKHERTDHTSGSEYLWDRSGQPDPQIERMEQTLALHRHRREPTPVFPEHAFSNDRSRWYETFELNWTASRLAAAALVLLAMACGLWITLTPRPPIAVPGAWQVEIAAARLPLNRPGAKFARKSWLRVGEALET